MNWLEALVLGLIQGLAEFLPISSSGHLEIGQSLLGVSGKDNLTFAIVVHVATVLSTIVVLWKEVEILFKGVLITKAWNAEKQYVAKIVISMIPVFVVGMFFKDYVESFFGNGLLIVGSCLLLTACLLTFAYYKKSGRKSEISYVDAFIIGLAQVVAVLPGLSRSGSTIATGLLLGNRKETIAQFSFLMVVVPILGEGLLEMIELIQTGTLGTELPLSSMLVGFFAAFISGCFACKFMINLVRQGKLIYFAIYCALIGAFTIVYSLL